MNDLDLNRRLQAAATVTDDTLHDPGLVAALLELGETIAGDVTTAEIPPVGAGRSGRRRFWLTAACVAAVVGAVSAIGLISSGPGSTPAYGAELVAFAQRSPQLLLSGGTVTYADDSPFGGEMLFQDGNSVVQLYWTSAPSDGLIADRLAGSTDRGELEVLGAKARIIESGDDEYDEYTAIWLSSTQTIELRAPAANSDEFAQILARLQAVDANEWLDAMPPSVIAPDARADAVDDVLRDIPLPDGFDPTAIADATRISDRYQLIAQVTGAVACAWLEQWFIGTETNDDQLSAQAAAGLATSTHWAALTEIENQGDWAEAIWEYADATNGGPGIGTGLGTRQPTRDLAASGLGCQPTS